MSDEALFGPGLVGARRDIERDDLRRREEAARLAAWPARLRQQVDAVHRKLVEKRVSPEPLYFYVGEQTLDEPSRPGKWRSRRCEVTVSTYRPARGWRLIKQVGGTRAPLDFVVPEAGGLYTWHYSWAGDSEPSARWKDGTPSRRSRGVLPGIPDGQGGRVAGTSVMDLPWHPWGWRPEQHGWGQTWLTTDGEFALLATAELDLDIGCVGVNHRAVSEDLVQAYAALS